MSPLTLAAVSSTLFCSLAPVGAQAPAAATPTPAQGQTAPASKDVVIRAFIVALPNAEAAQFATSQDLSGKPAEALDALVKMVALKKATSVANPALATRSGTCAKIESGEIILELDAVVSTDGKLANLNLVLSDHGHKISTGVRMSDGEVKFAGSVQSSLDKAMTDYIFIKTSF